jgi:hypothetical protein
MYYQNTPFIRDGCMRPIPPVEPFGNTSHRPWFWFQNFRNWKPQIRYLVVCSITAGSDIGLFARKSGTCCRLEQWRIWKIADETRRPTVPYDMERNEDTIVAGMQQGFTAASTLDEPGSSDDYLKESSQLPILLIKFNRSGEFAG